MVGHLALKARQIVAYFLHSRNPFALTLDAFHLKRTAFVARTREGLQLRLEPSVGESFTFYENMIRRDYLGAGIKLSPGDTVVDIGANIGSFAIVAASLVGPSGRVIALEPMPGTFQRLEQNVALNRLRNTKCECVAIDCEEGNLSLALSRKSALISAHLEQIEGDSGETLTVPCHTLERIFADYQIDRINQLKIDCEGSEYGIFESLTPEIAARIDEIAMEAHPVPGKHLSDLETNLQALGFEVRRGYTWFATNILQRDSPRNSRPFSRALTTA